MPALPSPQRPLRLRSTTVAAAVAWVLLLALFATLLKGTIVGTASDTWPVTLLLFLGAAGALRLLGRPRASAALGLTIILLAPLIARLPQVLASFSGTSSFRCEGIDGNAERLLQVVFFPVMDPGLSGAALALAAGAYWALERRRVVKLGAALRWLAVIVAIAAELWLLRYRGLPDAQAYLDAKPVVATLFPTTEIATKKPEEFERSYPVMTVGPVSVHRTCYPTPGADCRVMFAPAGRAPGFAPVEVGCVKDSQRVILRRDDAFDRWFAERDGFRYAFRLREGSERAEWTEISRRELLPFTAPPRGWLLTPALAALVALYAGVRRRLAARHLRELNAGVDGTAAGGFIEVPGPTRFRAPEGVMDGPVVVLDPILASPDDDRGHPEPRAARVVNGTKAALLDAAQLRVLDWDLHAVAAVALALLVVSPWLRFSFPYPGLP